MQQRDPHEEMNPNEADHDEATCEGGCCSKGAAYDPPAPKAPAGTVVPTVVLRLSVRNHPGVMSHVCGMFARRAFNLEGILVLPVMDGTTSTMLLLVHDDRRLDQLERQLSKLEDVLEIHREATGHRAFAAVAEFIG
jgi:acetolactate synthase-1/3 small subunit